MLNQNTKKLEEKLRSVKAQDVMSKFAITIKDNQTVTELAHLMMRFKISGIPVVTKNGEICGIVTATDLFMLMKKTIFDIEDDKSVDQYNEIKVTELMTENVVTITETTSLYEIMKIMCEKNIHTLPVMVVAKREILGVIGRRDILNAFYVGVADELK